MEDITAALCLDNRLRQRLYPTPLTNRRNHGISVFIRPIPSLSSFSPSLCNSLLFCPPVLPLISQWYSVSANGACLQGGHQIHYQVGQQFPHCFTHTVYYMEGGKGEKRYGGEMGGADVCNSFLKQIMSQRKYKLNTINNC